MRAVVQRVHDASVVVDGAIASSMQGGLLVYLGVSKSDSPADVEFLANKVRHLRVFPDGDGALNRDVGESGGDVMVVSAFTTQGDARKGRRPSFVEAAAPELARQLYEDFCQALGGYGLSVHQGRFREHMDVTSTNDGPICILLDSQKTF
ncbi:MAG: D-aminoacyl-tRNA deacylase [Phycisphaerae bacterium]|nr:MAG: D-aminoacyl-tRNA deacylase [Phycisphaerae bacterium]